MPNEIKFTATYGDEVKKVILSQPAGAGDGSWSINIDNYHYGVILVKGGEYCYVNDKLDINDVQAIVDRITDYKGEPRTVATIHINTWPKFETKVK